MITVRASKLQRVGITFAGCKHVELLRAQIKLIDDNISAFLSPDDHLLISTPVEFHRYEFWVVPDSFILHLPHSPSLDIARYRSSESYR